MDYPKTYNENMLWRREMLLRCRQDSTYREKVKTLFHRDILFAFNGFFYTLDVRKRPFQHQPFCTYAFQDDAILELNETIKTATAMHTEDILWEKSRDMGATWMILGTFLHFWLNPWESYDFLAGSRKEDYVDKIGDPRTHFSKLRYLIDRLPRWLLPKAFNRRRHDTYMKLQNPDTGSTITGESNNANFSTQGRYSAILFDEFAKWESTDVQAWTAAGDASPVRIANSTPFGAAGQYYDLSTDGRTKKITLHWSLHPEKADGLSCLWPKPDEADQVVDSMNWVGLTSPWYERELLRRTPLEVAQELDIDYIGAGNPFFDGLAGKRIGALLRAKMEPIKYLKADLIEMKLHEITNPVDYEDYITIYHEPDKKLQYVLAADVAEGRNEKSDHSVAKVMIREYKTLAATFNAQLDEIQFAKIIYLMTKYYTMEDVEEPWWAVEANGPGLATFDIVAEVLDLPNAFMMPKYDVTKQGISYRKGWWTDTNSRRMALAGIREWLLDGSGWVDPRCCREMTTFVIHNGKPQAKAGCNDDEVMAWGIALQVNEIAPYEGIIKPIVRRDDGLIKDPYAREDWTPVEEPTIEDRCLEQAIENQARISVDEVISDSIGSLFEQIEDLYD
jgi:hypothetical protein